ncbi:GNAT family N-acetyltransferase [Rothia nasimurium]|uniref:GNAT family N-acetyltransferase n=1 Tax=Rothia nasimurium TaxID=85336 RepID=UPI0016250A02|nr:GNAT family N-acetyltransferase [Rothia nasimurium]
MHPQLLTERFTLRPLREADAEAMAQACQDPDIIRFCLSVPLNYTEETARDFVAYAHQASESGHELVWGIDASGVFAGVVSLFNITGSSAEVGYWLAPGSRGQGFLTEALGMVVGFALDPQGLGLDRLSWKALSDNEASERVARRVGFTDFRTLVKSEPGRPLEDGSAPLLDMRAAELTRDRWAELGFPG